MGETRSISMQDVVGRGYADFWRSQKRYVVCKGSRASKKSTTAALKIIVRMMQYPEANTLVIRQTAESLKDSCYAQLLWAIDRLGVSAWWKATKSPLEIEYIPTGQRILFRGLDNPLKVTSITVKRGYLCFAWLEEAYEVDEDAFDKIDQSLRGQMPDGYYIQWLITFNPWDASCFLKRKFFDEPDDDVLAMTTTYKCNEWLSEADLKMFERMKRTDPEQYKVAGEGDWGLAEGQFFKQWSNAKHVIEPFKIPREWVKIRSMDWGSARPYAVLWFAIDYDGNAYCYRELYGYGGKPNEGTGETAKEVAEHIAEVETREENVYGAILDNACWASTGVTGPTIAEELNDTLYEHHLPAFDKSSKGRVEGANAIKQRLIGNEVEDGSTKPALYFFNTCYHAIRTIPMLAHDKTKPETYDTKGEDHCLVAGTLISTARGDIPIEKVIPGDYVLTRNGYRMVMKSALTKKAANVITVEFSNGVSLTGTGNHPVFVKEKGFIPLDAIQYFDIIYSIKEAIELCQESKQRQRTVSCLTVSHSEDTQIPNVNLIEDITEPMEDYAKKELTISTKRFGNSIMEKSQKGIIYTTRMGTRSITTSQTLNLSRAAATFHITQGKGCQTKASENESSKDLNVRKNLLKSGINQRPEGNGTGNMGRKLLKSRNSSLKSKRRVCVAEKNFSQQAHEETIQNSAPHTVQRNIGKAHTLMMKQGSAQSVGRSSESTNTAEQKHVGKNVVYAVCSYTAGKADVYNLTVDGVHEYFANGFLVHNCADALAYFCLSRPWAPTKPKKQKPRDGYAKEVKRSAWTY